MLSNDTTKCKHIDPSRRRPLQISQEMRSNLPGQKNKNIISSSSTMVPLISQTTCIVSIRALLPHKGISIVRKQNCMAWRGMIQVSQQDSSSYCTTRLQTSCGHYISPFDDADADWSKAFATLWFAPDGSGGLLASLSACPASLMSFWLRKLGWLVDDSSLAHIRSVIFTLFRVDVTLCHQKRYFVSTMSKSCLA